ncbi:MAG: PEGA domain-containing protein, partial [Deltaproteobacteria bacterium]|nr:PEGA domain-containing protein [Deltaproteobacteria bacterium]
WVRDLSSRASPPRQSSPEAAVDEAVRALLGAPTEVETHLAPPPDPTSPALTKPTTRRRTSTRQVPAVDPPSADASQNLGDTPGTARAKPALYPIDETLRTQAPPQPRARPLLWPILAILLLLALIPLTWLILRSPSQDDLRRASPAPRDSALPHVETTPALSQKKKPTPTQTRTRIKSVPPGAHIALNGIPRGHTPMTLPWPRGPSVLTFSKPGYHKTTLQLSSPPTEDAPIVVTLRRRRVSPQHPIGFLTVNTLPWSRVYLDGHLLGNTPLIDRHVRAGSHRLVIKDAHGHVRKRVKITVTPGKRQRLTFNLR